MEDNLPDKEVSKAAVRFLAFADDKEDAEKVAKLREAAARIEQSITREKALNELVDYQPSDGSSQALINPLEDSRPLYERLLEQRNKKKDEIDESHKLSNLVTKLEEDEVIYLNEVARAKREEEIKKQLEIHDALEAKKRLQMQKMVEQEKRRKEAFMKLGSHSAAIGGATIVKAQDKHSKSKLSSLIRVKPRNKMPDKLPDEDPGVSKDCDSHVHTKKRPNDDIDQDLVRKKLDQKADLDADRKDAGTDEIHHRTSVTADITKSRPFNVMTSIGVLPSTPTIYIEPKSDSLTSDSDDDDELQSRLVPRTNSCYKRRHKR